MIAALLYLQYHSFCNRLIRRLTRLKQPKYLIGAIVGGLYLYFYFFRYLFRGYGRRSTINLGLSPEHAQLYELLGALLLFVIVLLAWMIPHERAALSFSEAEVAFLFPAPVSRRTLIHFKLLRSQARIFFSVFILTLVSRRFGGNLWIHACGWWLILSILNLHFLGSSFVRTILLEHGISNWLRRLLVATVVIASAGVVWIWARRTLPPFNPADATNLDALLDYAQQVLTAGPALYLLYPFQLVIRPFLAVDVPAFVGALPPVLLLFLLHYLWVIYSNVAFEEASVAASQKLATRIAAIRAGNWQGNANRKAKRPWFRLTAIGPVAIALLWKNLLGIGRVISVRLWISISVILIVFGVSFGRNLPGGFSIIGMLFIGIVLAYSLLLGPQVLRLDFRNDLPLMDILKTFPMRGWQIALGEILAPAVVLTVIQWLLLLAGAVLIIYQPVKQEMLYLVIALSAVFVLPILDVLVLLIPNAAVLLFPSWIQTGKDSPRGIENTGQRLILALAQMLILLLMLLPAAAAFAGIFVLFNFALGPVAAILPAALAATIVMAVEAGFGLVLLGKLFQRFDVADESGN